MHPVQSVNEGIICKKIYEMGPEKIEYITSKVARVMIDNLVSQRTLELENSEGSEQQSHLKIYLFSRLIKQLRREISQLFSVPDSFLQQGLNLSPKRLMQEVTDGTNIVINPNDLPHKYKISLQVDQPMSEQKRQLIFLLIQSSADMLEFSRNRFALPSNL